MTEKPRFSITLDYKTFEALENYRYEKHISTRSKAASKLIEIALDMIENGNEPPTMPLDDNLILDGFHAANDTRRADMLYLARQSVLEKKARSKISGSSEQEA